MEAVKKGGVTNCVEGSREIKASEESGLLGIARMKDVIKDAEQSSFSGVMFDVG